MASEVIKEVCQTCSYRPFLQQPVVEGERTHLGTSRSGEEMCGAPCRESSPGPSCCEVAVHQVKQGCIGLDNSSAGCQETVGTTFAAVE